MATVDSTTADAGAPDAVPSPPPGAGFEITLERTMCYGVCPAYTVTIRGDGSISYDGSQFVKVHGAATSHVTTAAAAALAAKFDGAHFDAIKIPDPCPKGMATDHPSIRLTYVHGGTRHKVDAYLGNMCVPSSVETLADAVDKTADTAKWVRCGPKPDDYCKR